MTWTHRALSQLLMLATLLAAATGPLVHAQDAGDEPADLERAQPEVQRPVLRVDPAIRTIPARFQEHRDRFKANLERLLSGRLDELNTACGLTLSQAKKLTVAGNGDIKRVMDQWDQIAAKLADSAPPADNPRASLLLIHQLNVDASALNDGFLGDDSFFGKTLTRTLNPEQAAHYEQSLAESRRRQYEGIVRRAVSSLRANLVLSERQEAELAQLVLKETRPPKKFGRAADVALVLFQISRLPDSTVKPIFDEGQWKTFSHWASVYTKGSRALEVLRRNGFIFDDQPKVARPVEAEPGKEPKNSEG